MPGLPGLVDKVGWAEGRYTREDDLVVWEWGCCDAPVHRLGSDGGKGRKHGKHLAAECHADCNRGPGLFSPGVPRQEFPLHSSTGKQISNLFPSFIVTVVDLGETLERAPPVSDF